MNVRAHRQIVINQRSCQPLKSATEICNLTEASSIESSHSSSRSAFRLMVPWNISYLAQKSKWPHLAKKTWSAYSSLKHCRNRFQQSVTSLIARRSFNQRREKYQWLIDISFQQRNRFFSRCQCYSCSLRRTQIHKFWTSTRVKDSISPWEFHTMAESKRINYRLQTPTEVKRRKFSHTLWVKSVRIGTFERSQGAEEETININKNTMAVLTYNDGYRNS